jgi:hypothetical protein
MADVNLSVSAELGDLRRQLQTIPGITADQARLMVAELDRGFRRAEQAAAAAGRATRASMEAAERATRDAANAADNLGDSIGAVGGTASKLAGGLDLLVPGLGGLAGGVADLADMGEVAAGAAGGMGALAGSAAALAAPLAIAALVIAPLIYAFMAEKRAAEAAAAALVEYEDATKAASAANEDFNDAMADVNDQFALIFGHESKNEQQARKSEVALRKQALAANEAAQKLIDVAVAQQELAKNVVIGGVGYAVGADNIAKQEEMSKVIREQTAIIDKNTEEMELAIEVFKGKAKADDQAAANAERAAAREKAAAEAARRAAEAAREAAEAERLVAEAKAAHMAMLGPLLAAEKQIESQRFAELEQSEKLAVKLDELRALKLQLAAAGKLSAEEAAKFAAVEKAMASDLTKALLTEETKRQAGVDAIAKKAKDKAAADEKTRTEEEKSANAERLNAIAQVADVVAQYTQYSLDQDVAAYEQAQEARNALGKNATKAEKDLADERLAITRNAARKAFLIDKAAKMASAAAATALAFVQALSSGPPPFNFIAAAAVGAAGLIQQGVIMSQQPSFHAGGFVGGGMAPDEQQATVRRGEAVLSPAGRRAMGDDAIRAANGGMGGGQTIVVQQVYRHRVFDSFVRDNLRTRGPLSQALGAGSRAGQRS